MYDQLVAALATIGQPSTENPDLRVAISSEVRRLTRAVAPFADLDVDADNWELTTEIDLSVASGVAGSYTIEAGSKNSHCRLRVQPITGYDETGMVQHGAPLVDLRDQTTGPVPLEWLEGLMSGGMA